MQKTNMKLLILCEISRVSRSGYYAWVNTNSIDKNILLKQCILDLYNKSKKIYGYRRIKIGLKRLLEV